MSQRRQAFRGARLLAAPASEAIMATTAKPIEAPRVTLKAICAELNLDPRLAVEKLRIAAREPKKIPEFGQGA